MIMQLQAKEHQELLGSTRTRKWRERNFSLEPSERGGLASNLDFRLLASRAVGEQMSVAFSHSVCGNFTAALES